MKRTSARQATDGIILWFLWLPDFVFVKLWNSYPSIVSKNKLSEMRNQSIPDGTATSSSPPYILDECWNVGTLGVAGHSATATPVPATAIADATAGATARATATVGAAAGTSGGPVAGSRRGLHHHHHRCRCRYRCCGSGLKSSTTRSMKINSFNWPVGNVLISWEPVRVRFGYVF